MQPVIAKSNNEEVEKHLRQMAKSVMSEISGLDVSRSKELLGVFVSELFLLVAKEEQKEVRRQRQAEGIAAAKARGVRFGAVPKPLPENFDECYEAWQDGRMTAAEAAEKCGLSRGAFYRGIKRKEQTASRAV